MPADLGGSDAGIDEVVRARRMLGGCASTALAVNMHLFQVGAGADGWRASGANEAALRRVATDGIVLGSTGAEAIVAGASSTPTTAERVGDEYVVTGRKYLCSQADAMDVVRVSARDTDTDEILVLAVPRTAPGVEVVETWDTMGMRATASHDVVLEHVRVPAASVAARLPAEAPAWHPAFANTIRWSLTLTSSVHMGIADRALEEAYDDLGRRGSREFRAAALTNAMVGRLEATHFRASAVFGHGPAEVAAPTDPAAGLVTAITMKKEATGAAADVVDSAVVLVGGRSYLRKSVLERLARDVRAARHHPPAAPVSHQMIGIHARERHICKGVSER